MIVLKYFNSGSMLLMEDKNGGLEISSLLYEPKKMFFGLCKLLGDTKTQNWRGSKIRRFAGVI